MKKEELFRNMSDIDDDLIDETNSRRGKTDIVSPIRITESKKKFNFKPVAAAACCVILAGVVTAVGINYGNNNIKTALPEGSGTEAVQTQVSGSASDNNVHIAEETGFLSARYQYKGDYSEFKDFSGVVCLEFPYYIDTYRTALNLCEIAVVGEFVDAPCQDIDPDDYTEIYPESFHSYNRFKIDKVLKGGTATDKVAVGNEIIIEQDYAVKGGSILSKSKLTPMLKGDRWVYFLSYSEELGAYYPTYDYMCRFPDPSKFQIYNRDPDLVESGNRFLPAVTNKYGLTDAKDFNKNVFRTLTEILCPNIMPAVECLYDTENLELYNVTTFEMAAFEGVVFELRDGCLYVDEPWSSVSQDGALVVGGNGVSVSKLFITDLNGDGKGEICTEVHYNCNGNGEICAQNHHNYGENGNDNHHNQALNNCHNESCIFAWDYANKQGYFLGGKEGESEYVLAESNGELIAYKTEFTADSSQGSVISDEKLSLDIMSQGGVIPFDYLRNSEDSSASEPQILSTSDIDSPTVSAPDTLPISATPHGNCPDCDGTGYHNNTVCGTCNGSGLCHESAAPQGNCPDCNGTGYHNNTVCGTCNGSGSCHESAALQGNCPDCNGTGHHNNVACGTCNGSGWYTAQSHHEDEHHQNQGHH